MASQETCLREFEPELRDLAEELQMSTKLSLREGHFATTALRAEPSSPNAITSPIGSRIHLSIGSASAVLLARMPDCEIKAVLASAPEESWGRQKPDDVWRRIRGCREQGACFELGQYHSSIYACSVPLQLTETDLVSLTAVGWPEDFAGAKQGKIVQALRQRVAAM